MPHITSGLVLVTGASGFLGVYTVRALADVGYKVRAAVRDNIKGAYVQSQVPGAEIEIALVPDMTAPGAYNGAVKGVDAIIHVASPLDVTNTGPPEAVIGPAVQGVVALLDAAATEPKFMRVVQFSSVAAMGASLNGEPHQFTEEDWNEFAIQGCEKLGSEAPGGLKYAASKTLAERSFWEYFKTPRSFDGVAINPGLLFGPPAGYPPTKIQGSNETLVPWVTTTINESELKTKFYDHVDVRDTAKACALALASPAAGGERFIVNKGATHGNDFAIAAERVNDPKLTMGNRDPKFRAILNDGPNEFSSAKAERVLGLELRDTDETFGDAAVGIRKILDAKV